MEPFCKHQSHLPSPELKRDQFIPDDRAEPCREEDDLPDIDEVQISECEKFENLFLIGKMFGESVPLKTIISKTKADWIPTREVKYVSMGNGLFL